MTTVAELQPDPNNKIRIESTYQSANGVYHDGIVRSVKCVNAAENVYEVTLFSTTYNRESTVYVRGSDRVTEPARRMNAHLAAEGDHEREMEERRIKDSFRS
ncbi:hypothetical protein [Streptomyces caelestis]|uniref:hypothetical protein n=1 Tax=Streptomyces caelestis TaxID=36816 RepID=UPI0036522E1C